MATSLLEKTRSLHEDVERCQRMIVQLRMEEPKTHKSKITIDLKVNKYLELIQDRSNKLRAIYEDKDNLRRDDISRITGQGPEVFSAFYDTMREMRGYYAKFPDMTIEKPEDVAYKLVMEDDELSQFTGEESFGRFLDLHEHYLNFLNLKQNKGKRIDYTDYLMSLHSFDDRLETKDQPYRNYLQLVLEYLITWYRRAKPLTNVDGLLKEVEEDLEKRWDGNWSWERAEREEKDREHEKIKSENSAASSSSTTDLDAIDLDDAPPAPATATSLDDIDDGPAPMVNGNVNANGNEEEEEAVKPEPVVKIEIPDDQPIDLKKFSSAKELEAVGLERLKRELQSKGLICGGTLGERAARLYLLKDSPIEALSSSLLAHPGNKSRRRRKKGKKAETAKNNPVLHKQITLLECKIRKLALTCQDKIEATKQHVEKKQSRTVDEILAEGQADDVAGIISSKAGLQYVGPDLDAMKAVADAHAKRSLKLFQTALRNYTAQLGEDPIVHRHLSSLYDTLLEQNLCRLIEPYSKVEIAHVAEMIELPVDHVEKKLSQMILDKKFAGTLDQGAGCLVIFEDPKPDAIFPATLETISNIGKVVDSLYVRSARIMS